MSFPWIPYAAAQPAQDSAFSPPPYLWGLIGNDGQHLVEEREAGIEAKLLSLSWRQWFRVPGVTNTTYVERKRAELMQLRQAGFSIILSLGYHDTPPWVHELYPSSRYLNQYGEAYDGAGEIDSGDANLVFNAALRELVALYVENVFTTLGTDFVAVRVGGGRWGELTYPPAAHGLHTNAYWAFDANAQAQSPVPGWVPGMASPGGEARRFLEWYLQTLVDYQSWQIATVARHFSGAIMVLYPGWGIRPGRIEQALATDLAGSAVAERSGEIAQGRDFARQIAAITRSNVIVTTTWLEADPSRDDGTDQRYWSSIKYLAQLVAIHPLRLRLYAENSGQDDAAAMELAARQVQRYGMIGMAWYREDELFSGQYATLDHYRQAIRTILPPRVVFLPLVRGR
ncbi:MAG TPA: hypothetical protein VEZ12_11970 [Herpetosiphonaceae bacterium]|nr:hypothetical protein [Herpetosiphonaceae bacterium]